MQHSVSTFTGKIRREYAVVKYYKLELLESDVNVKINEGWELVGGVAICQDGSLTWFCQAVTRTRSLLSTQHPIIDDDDL
jgi:hypothetical protein